MTESSNTSITVAAVAFIILLPVLIIAAGELQERLRQRGSLLEKPVRTLRNWFLPSAALLVIVTVLLDQPMESSIARLLATFALVSLTVAVMQAIRYAFARARKRAETPGIRSVPRLLILLPQIFVLLVASWLLVDAIWDVDLSGLVAALGVTSLIVSLALQPTLSGLASGFLILTDRPFQPGDWITVSGVEGVVTDIGWRTSSIQDRNRDVHVLPNSQISEATITNYSQPAQLHRVVVSLQVLYSNPPTRAEEMLLAAGRSTPNVLTDPPPHARIVAIDDPLMGWEVDLWIDDYAHMPQVKSDFGALIWYHSNRMSVPLPSPAYDLYHHDPIQEAADAEMPSDEIVAHLGLAAEFAELDAADFAALALTTRAVRYRRGELIIGHDGPDGQAFLLWQGEAKMVNADDPRASVTIGAGDIVGDLVPSLRLRVEHAVLAVTDCEMLVLNGHETGAIAARLPDVSGVWRETVAIRSARLTALPGIVDSLQLVTPDSADETEDSGEVSDS